MRICSNNFARWKFHAAFFISPLNNLYPYRYIKYCRGDADDVRSKYIPCPEKAFGILPLYDLCRLCGGTEDLL